MAKLALAFVVVTAAAAACTSDPGTEDAMSPGCQEATTHSDLTWIQANVFTPSCVISGCHKSPAVNAGHLSLDATLAYDNLVNAPSQVQVGWKRVVPGDPASSYMLVALGVEGGPPPPDGLMPLSSPALCSQKLDAIQRWIEAGADND